MRMLQQIDCCSCILTAKVLITTTCIKNLWRSSHSYSQAAIFFPRVYLYSFLSDSVSLIYALSGAEVLGSGSWIGFSLGWGFQLMGSGLSI